MAISNEIRKLDVKWRSGSGWPKRLNSIRLSGLRGWTGQSFEMRFPIMAVTGENGVGKSSIIQAAAAIYKPDAKPRFTKFASDFFPDTYWETIKQAQIDYRIQEGKDEYSDSIRKPGERWRGNPERRERPIAYIDLNRIQPVSARVGYTRLVKGDHHEVSATTFDQARLVDFSEVMGREYDLAKMALTNMDVSGRPTRPVPVLSQNGIPYSGFHQGAGETTVAELFEVDPPKYSLVLIDEIESSLHPRAQRRLVRYLAEKCREREWQVILTTHSPYVLGELPPEARAYIMQIDGVREIVYGVSPEFAMSRMDDVAQPECDLYVEDHHGKAFLTEILVKLAPKAITRCQVISYGAASVGQALGQMVSGNRFPRISRVFLDGDQPEALGCLRLPGGDAPERVVFERLRLANWGQLASRVGRPFADVADHCSRAMTKGDHHDWVVDAATGLLLGGDILWQAMCAEWVSVEASDSEAKQLADAVEDALEGGGVQTSGSVLVKPNIVGMPKLIKKTAARASSGQTLLFSKSSDTSSGSA